MSEAANTQIPAAPKGYSVRALPIRFDDLATNNTFVWGIDAPAHYRKVTPCYAERVDDESTQQYRFVGQRVFQTVPAPLREYQIDHASLPFEACDEVQLAILPGIRHKAEVISHDGVNRWKVQATINEQTFEFIVYEHQIQKPRSWIVTGFIYLGQPEIGGVACDPVVEAFSGFTATEAMNKAQVVHDENLYIVSVIEIGTRTAYTWKSGELVPFDL